MKPLSFICIALVFSTIYLLINCSVYGESCRTYSLLSFRFFSQPFVRFWKKIKMLFTSQDRAHAVARFFESPFFPVFIFALFFCFFTRGQSELCDELQQRRPVKCQRVVASMEVDKENEFPPFYCKNHRQEKQPLSITDARAVTFHLKVSPSFLH